MEGMEGTRLVKIIHRANVAPYRIVSYASRWAPLRSSSKGVQDKFTMGLVVLDVLGAASVGLLEGRGLRLPLGAYG